MGGWVGQKIGLKIMKKRKSESCKESNLESFVFQPLG
jgi:hypothetical protein